MASQAQLGAWLGGQHVIDPDMDPTTGKPSTNVATLEAATSNIAQMRAKLKAADANGSLYTDDYLDSLNANDLLFACRTEDLTHTEA